MSKMFNVYQGIENICKKSIENNETITKFDALRAYGDDYKGSTTVIVDFSGETKEGKPDSESFDDIRSLLKSLEDEEQIEKVRILALETDFKTKTVRTIVLNILISVHYEV